MAVPKWPALTVAKLTVRDGRRCIHCGATDTLTVQHRGVKGIGGRRSADRPSNGVILCWALNVAAEQDLDAMQLCLQMGWKISSHADPSKTPVWDANTGEHYLLTDQYSRERVAPSNDDPAPPPPVRGELYTDTESMATR